MREFGGPGLDWIVGPRNLVEGGQGEAPDDKIHSKVVSLDVSDRSVLINLMELLIQPHHPLSNLCLFARIFGSSFVDGVLRSSKKVAQTGTTLP